MPPSERCRQCPECLQMRSFRHEQIYCSRSCANSARLKRKPPPSALDNEIRRLIEAGWTRAAIGRALGITKNVVIGKAYRMGLSPPQRQRTALTPDPFPERDQCRYPIGHPRDDGFHFCAAAIKPGSPYCQKHHGKCYVPASKAMAEAA
jgi:GcrA cell cycle regulator